MRQKFMQTAHVLLSLWPRFLALLRDNHILSRDSSKVNLNRVIICALFAIPINLIHIAVYSLLPPGNAIENSWRTGIAQSHLVVMALMVLFLVAAVKIRKSERKSGAKFLQVAMPLTFLMSGAAVTAIDKLVTINITPFVLVTMIAGSMFLLRPLLSASLFIAGYAAFFFALGFDGNSDVLLSNRTNGLTAIAIGYALSWTMWRHFSVELMQRRQIEAQSEELERVNRELQNMAFTDSLTGLPNRRYFDQVMTRELSAIERGGPPASVIEFDLDHFKEINDTCGHEAGDEILRQVAGLASGAVRKADMFARYGGEEFILLLPGTALDGALEAAEKLRRRLEEHAFQIDGQEVRLTASFGVAELRANPIISFYRSVDHALYHAKQLGRNRVEASELSVPPDVLAEA